MDERRTSLVYDALECGLTRCQRRSTIHDAAPVPSHRRFLHCRGIVWHDDVRWYPTQPCRQRHCCRMIPRGMRGDPVPGFLVQEGKDRVARAAELEGTHLLEIF